MRRAEEKNPAGGRKSRQYKYSANMVQIRCKYGANTVMGVGGGDAGRGLFRPRPEGERSPGHVHRREDPHPPSAAAVHSGPPFPRGLGEAGRCSGSSQRGFVLGRILFHTLPGPQILPEDAPGLSPEPAAPSVPSCRSVHAPARQPLGCPSPCLPQSMDPSGCRGVFSHLEGELLGGDPMSAEANNECTCASQGTSGGWVPGVLSWNIPRNGEGHREGAEQPSTLPWLDGAPDTPCPGPKRSFPQLPRVLAAETSQLGLSAFPRGASKQ